jgi:hypothetical protein
MEFLTAELQPRCPVTITEGLASPRALATNEPWGWLCVMTFRRVTCDMGK